MQKEILIIKHFRLIRNVELKDIKQFLFLVGESGSGKNNLPSPLTC